MPVVKNDTLPDPFRERRRRSCGKRCGKWASELGFSLVDSDQNRDGRQ